ncbi:MAG: FHA domain-containing protein [Melioribacteraceae bacterium]|nr:FHA domain-containing protein [Melioribacteraceae bacterium]
MKYKVVCEYCNEDIFFEDIDKKPSTCPHCGDFVENLKIIELSVKENEADEEIHDGLILVCQNTEIELHLNHDNEIIIARENFDEKIPGKKYISGFQSGGHCKIEFEEKQYNITDLNSTNGTYIGIERVDCKAYPKQIINDGDILYLGREPFLIKIDTISLLNSKKSDSDILEKEESVIKKFRCKNCNFIVDERVEICPNCEIFRKKEDWEFYSEN